MSYCTVSERCQDGILAAQPGIATWLVVQEIGTGMLRLSRIEESKIYCSFRCRVTDDRKKAPRQFCLGGCSLFAETESFRT
jgi:hypothetical protein